MGEITVNCSVTKEAPCCVEKPSANFCKGDLTEKQGERRKDPF